MKYILYIFLAIPMIVFAVVMMMISLAINIGSAGKVEVEDVFDKTFDWINKKLEKVL